MRTEKQTILEQAMSQPVEGETIVARVLGEVWREVLLRPEMSFLEHTLQLGSRGAIEAEEEMTPKVLLMPERSSLAWTTFKPGVRFLEEAAA